MLGLLHVCARAIARCDAIYCHEAPGRCLTERLLQLRQRQAAIGVAPAGFTGSLRRHGACDLPAAASHRDQRLCCRLLPAQNP